MTASFWLESEAEPAAWNVRAEATRTLWLSEADDVQPWAAMATDVGGRSSCSEPTVSGNVMNRLGKVTIWPVTRMADELTANSTLAVRFPPAERVPVGPASGIKREEGEMDVGELHTAIDALVRTVPPVLEAEPAVPRVGTDVHPSATRVIAPVTNTIEATRARFAKDTLPAAPARRTCLRAIRRAGAAGESALAGRPNRRCGGVGSVEGGTFEGAVWFILLPIGRGASTIWPAAGGLDTSLSSGRSSPGKCAGTAPLGASPVRSRPPGGRPARA